MNNIRVPPFRRLAKCTPVHAEEARARKFVARRRREGGEGRGRGRGKARARESSSRARYEIKEKASPSFDGGVVRGGRVAGWRPGHPGPTHEDVPSPGVSYRRPKLIPPLKLGPHPQSCAVSTHRPMKAPVACKLAAPAPAIRGRATPTKHHVARVRVARAFAEQREPGARESGRSLR